MSIWAHRRRARECLDLAVNDGGGVGSAVGSTSPTRELPSPTNGPACRHVYAIRPSGPVSVATSWRRRLCGGSESPETSRPPPRRTRHRSSVVRPSATRGAGCDHPHTARRGAGQRLGYRPLEKARCEVRATLRWSAADRPPRAPCSDGPRTGKSYRLRERHRHQPRRTARAGREK